MTTIPLLTESQLIPPSAEPPVQLPAEAAVAFATPQHPAPHASDQHFVFHDADWRLYELILQAVGDRHVRLTYDRGRLELMSLSHAHERCSKLLGQMVETLTEELNLPRQSGGSTTFKREDLARGLEPDQCYYLKNEALVRGKDELDLTTDPPPDLAIEIDISRSSLDRLAIYAALGVPEVWVYNGEVLTVYQLSAPGQYSLGEFSTHFPNLALKKITEVLQRRKETNETQLVRDFRHWLREQIAHNWQPTT